nr:MAG TPA: hypothetical protein [Bacteriophage sp.]
MEIRINTPGKHRTFVRGFGDHILTNRQTYIKFSRFFET